MKILTFLCAFAISATANLSAAFDHSHSAFTTVLKKHVSGESVDYAGLKKSPDQLGAYINSLASVSESEFKGWNEDQEKAFLINLYNAATLKLIVDHYPLKSIKDIGSPWGKKVVKLFGSERSLDYVEHDLLRKNYNDPRIHFGVNCASIGCPALRAEAFQATKLDAQLDEQARKFLGDSSKNRLDKKQGVLYLSSIFDWFKGDFVKKSGSVEKFVAPYFNDADAKAIRSSTFRIKYTDYDWNLNK
jgi:hypothetical protein